MTPSARLQAAIEILETLQASMRPADRLLREWAHGHRFAGSKDRAAIAERVYAALRRYFSLVWRVRSDDARSIVIASLLAEEIPLSQLERLFDGARYAPAPLSEDERRRICSPPDEPMPRSAKGEYPSFLEPELERAFGTRLIAEMRALTERAPIDLRVNTLKATRDDVLDKLRAEGHAAEPMRFSRLGIRLPWGTGLSALGRHPLFEHGAFEFQDQAAQLAALLACVRPGERVLDLAAGAGGKSLALAAEMKDRGEIIACDIDKRRLSALAPRAARAGVSIIKPELLATERPKGVFDVVFVDAPCSGTGIWRRQPELRMRLTPERLAELMALQDRLLDRAATSVAAGGRLLYATCSILPCENDDRLAAFLSRHPQFRPVNAAAIWRQQGAAADLPGPDDFFHASPYATETDGFFAGLLRLEAA